MDTIYYTKTARVLHWVMAIIFIIAWTIGFISMHALKGDAAEYIGSTITLHKNIASVLIFLVIIRIFWRFTHPAPKLPDTMSPVMKGAAHFGHLLLYIILLLLPISGALLSWSSGHQVPVLYLFDLPKLVKDNPKILAYAEPTHIYTAWIAGFVVLGHILMALKHHFIDRDTVLISMLGPRK
ncbi:cytochrome b [Neisseriaceae bacterium PsAf]|nr:cytochrome b [Neisseriaceae bacterium PsAf]MCV2502764.1 cytochrome b [Neisseriaceae bacterium]